MSAPTYTPIGVAARIGNVPDDVPVRYGTDADVGQEFDGTLLRFFDSGDESRLTLDPATSTMELVFPTATSPTESPILRLYHEEDGSTQSPADTIGQIDFATQNDDGTKMAYTRILSRFGFGTNSEELGVLSFQVLSRGDMTELLSVAGDTFGIGVDRVTMKTNLSFDVAGKSMLVKASEAAFRFDIAAVGATPSPSSAGLFFMTGVDGTSTAGFEFRDATGGVAGRLTVDGLGGMLIRSGTGTTAKGFDVLSAGQMNLGRNTATIVKCWQDFEMDDAENIILATGTGTKIGTAVGQKLGFWNATPVIQQAAAAQAALTNSTGGTADGTLAAISGTGDDAGINNNFTELHTLLGAIRTALVNTGIIKGAA